MKIQAKKIAFTLAEALMALTVVGVLMVLMVRSINRVSPDKEKLLFIKTYHAIEHAVVNTINDPSRYDPNYYSDNDIGNMSEAEKSNLHVDFRYTPLKDAKVHINGQEIRSCIADSPTTPCINQSNAMCYFIADSVNTVGEVNCTADADLNFMTSNGVCIRDLVGVKNDGSKDVIIDPLCNNEGYAVWVYNDGKMTVPSTHTGVGDRQATAYNWMLDQTQVK